MSTQQSILFLNPDYHYSFLYKRELSNRGWKADVFVPHNYPKNLLFENSGLQEKKRKTRLGQSFHFSLWLLTKCWKYRYIVYYGKIRLPFYMNKKFPFYVFFRNKCLYLELMFLKAIGRRFIYLPSGCHDEFSKSEFGLFDNGNVCSNCGFEDRCDDELNILNFRIVEKYFSSAINLGFYEMPHYQSTTLRYKCADFDFDGIRLTIPDKYLLPKTDAIRVMHATSLETRRFRNRNIKGSPFIQQAVEKLSKEGFKIEYLHLRNIPAKDMKYLQVQADIYIDQLIYGMWGSSGIEAMCLGKPVICYIRKKWKENFLESFDYDELPVIESTTSNIYSVLQNLLQSPNLLIEYQKKASKFSKKHYDVLRNVSEFIAFLEKLK